MIFIDIKNYNQIHQPVMPDEVFEYLNPKRGGNYIDATAGFGGHSECILRSLPRSGWLIGMDQDVEALAVCKERLAGKYEARLDLVKSNFSYLGGIVRELGMEASDGILFDLGVSSHQLSSQTRGFSFLQDGPLDMRMNLAAEFSAADVVNQYDEDKLADVIKTYGGERWAKRIARFIVTERTAQPILTTSELIAVMRRAIPSKVRHGNRIHFATRTFQALRMEVNQELQVLIEGMEAAFNHLRKGGRMVIITFHSLEDRLVKRSFKRWSQEGLQEQRLRIITRKPLLPTAEEIRLNPRSRSAKMRIAEKI